MPTPIDYLHRDSDAYGGAQLNWNVACYNRPRRAEHDTDFCLGGRVPVSEIPL